MNQEEGIYVNTGYDTLPPVSGLLLSVGSAAALTRTTNVTTHVVLVSFYLALTLTSSIPALGVWHKSQVIYVCTRGLHGVMALLSCLDDLGNC